MAGRRSDPDTRTPRIACRVPLFAPTRRPTRREHFVVTTQWGTATITGCLGQGHRDVMDALASATTAWRTVDRGHMEVTIDPARLRATLGWDRMNYSRLLGLLRDLKQAELTITDSRTGRVTETSPITEIQHDGDRITRRQDRSLFGAGTQAWTITIHAAWVQLMKEAATTYSTQVYSLRYGESQALARFMLSHAAGASYALDTALNILGVRRADKARKRLAADTDALAALGIVFVADSVTRPRTP